jgi:hypothetical protein
VPDETCFDAPNVPRAVSRKVRLLFTRPSSVRVDMRKLLITITLVLLSIAVFAVVATYAVIAWVTAD